MSPRMNRGGFTGDRVAAKNGIKDVAASLRPYYSRILFSITVLIISVVLSIVAPQIAKQITNELSKTLNPMTPKVDLDKVTGLCLGLVSLYLVNILCSFLSSFVMTGVSQYYTRDLRQKISEKINKIPLRYFDSSTFGDILSRITNDIDTLGQSIQQSISSLISSIFMLVGVIFAMFITAWPLALTVLASLPLLGIVLAFIAKVARPLFARRQRDIAKVESLVEESYSGQLIIKAFGAEKRKNEEFNKANSELFHSLFYSEICGGMMMPMMNFVSNLAYGAVMLVGGLLLSDHNKFGVDYGTITAFLIYINLFQSPLSQIGQAVNNLQSGGAAASRVFEFLNEAELSNEDEKAYPVLTDVKGEVVFDHVSFSYDPSREIIHDFSASIKPGNKVAIVGPTGAGKTTMVNLLMRFYEIGSGSVTIDGHPISELRREEIHDLFAMVLQDSWIFEGSLRENLVYSAKGVSDEEIYQAIEDAGLSHFVSTLPGQLDYKITDASVLSGGERQLLTIARAMLKKAPLLILDEATSNVDTRTEEKIQEAMDRLSKGKTSFVIAHRLSTIKNADLILVMKDGNIIEQGNHEELMKADGFYASLYNSQFSFE